MKWILKAGFKFVFELQFTIVYTFIVDTTNVIKKKLC